MEVSVFFNVSSTASADQTQFVDAFNIYRAACSLQAGLRRLGSPWCEWDRAKTSTPLG